MTKEGSYILENRNGLKMPGKHNSHHLKKYNTAGTKTFPTLNQNKLFNFF